MTTKTSTRPTGAITRILDPQALLELGRKHLQASYPDFTVDEAQLQHGPLPQMIFRVDDMKAAAVVNNEGVGATQSEDGTIEVTFSYGMTYTPIRIPLDELGAAVTDQTIDLAEGIRTFGIRLDVNHATWHRQYAGIA